MLFLDPLNLGCQSNFKGFIYHPMVGSSQCNFFYQKFTQLLPFLWTIKLLFVIIIMYNCPQQLLTTSCAFPMIVQTYVIQGKGVTTHNYNKLKKPSIH